jgi:hypothetical protein
VIVDEAERADAIRLRLRKPLAIDHFAHDVTHGLRAAAIAASLHQPVDRLEQIVVDGDGDALHGEPPGLCICPE